MKWPEAAIEDLRRLWHEQLLTAGQICNHLVEQYGMVGLTRNAVIGKIHRLHFPPHKPSAATARQPQSAELAFKSIPLLKPILQKQQRIVHFGQFKIVDLNDRNCRWPMGEDPSDMRYCGRLQVSGTSYCQQHLDIAWVLRRR